MSDLMLLGVLRAPTPGPDDVLGIAQLADRARQAADALEAKDKRIAELEARLEIYPVNLKTGEPDYDNALPESCDGIACRDETIRLQDRRIKRLEQEVLHHIGECVDNCKFCGE